MMNIVQTIEAIVYDAYIEGHKTSHYTHSEYDHACKDHESDPQQFGEPLPFKHWLAKDWEQSDAKAAMEKALESLEGPK